MRFFSRIKGFWHSLCATTSGNLASEELPPALAELLPRKRASVFREPLRLALVGQSPAPAWIGKLQEQALAVGWPDVEMEKLLAYVEFFTGAAAQAYQRVMLCGLANTDFEMFMTACVHCYLADRFEEGYALIRCFRPEDSENIDNCEYYAFAGYLTLAAGGDIREAVRYFDVALENRLYSPALVANAYPIYLEAGLDEQVRHLQELARRDFPDDPEVIYALSWVELARDSYGEGFRLAESRYDMPESWRSINASLKGKIRWQGEDIAGKRLLVHAEQGLGDIIMMARYLPLLRTSRAKVTLECRPEALTLLSYNFPDVEVVEGDIKKPIEVAFDIWTGAMSLPFRFKTTADAVPATAGYLKVPPEQKAYWQQRVRELETGEAPRIGIAWSGNPEHRADKRRSIPFEQIARHIRQTGDIQFFALQTRVPAIHPSNLVNLAEEMLTLADTAALIQEMDMVITVDTSIVHIAGALGKPTWLLLPSRYEWRWSLQGEKNNWYDSVRVLRQKTHGNWASLLDEVFQNRIPEFIRGNKANS